LFDQGVVSGGNFLTNLILIRTLAPREYGAYVLLLSAILFLNNLQTNMITYPVCVFGARADEDERKRVTGAGMIATFLASPLIAAVLFAVCLSLHAFSLAFVAAGATILWQLQEMARTSLVCRLRYASAVPGDAFSYLGQAALLGAICLYRVPSLSLVFVVILGTSMVAASWQGLQTGVRFPDRNHLRQLFSGFWDLGKWSTLSKVVSLMGSPAFPWVLAYGSGLAMVASYQSLYQMVSIANPLLLGLNMLIVTSVAGKSAGPNPDSRVFVVKQLRLAGLLLAGYFAALAFFGPYFFRLMYGSGSTYLANVRLLPYFAFAYALEGVAIIANAVLGGLGEARMSFNAQLSAAFACVFLVFPIIFHGSLATVAWGLIAVAGIRAVASWAFAWRRLGAQYGMSAEIQVVEAA
jgi:O-antigen/teichoic acid export membrane protein